MVIPNRLAGALAVAVSVSYAFAAPHPDKSVETIEWWNEAYELRFKMVSLWFDEPLANVIINECKAVADNPPHCIITATFIAKAESGGGNSVTECKNVFGVSGQCFASRTQSVEDWVKRYAKYWYKRKNPNDFYSDSPLRKPATRYCMSEHSSNSEWFCPNGFRHAWNAYNLLTK